MSNILKIERPVEAGRQDFPIFHERENGEPLIYLDSAATSQKPASVIDTIAHFYKHNNANVHRGLYALSERATAAYEGVRQSVREFIHAKYNHEIIFTRGTTESINLVASSYGRAFLRPGDEILISTLEHHSNIVPWQVLCAQTGATLKVIPILDNGTIDRDAYQSLLNPNVKLVSLVHVSNALGTVNPVKTFVDLAHQHGIPILLDGAQAVPHLPVDVSDLDCDFYAFSAHKMYGPMGIGVLYAKEQWLEAMPPYQTGGDMISRVTFAATEYNILPHKFEAGTPNVEGVVGLGAAIEYLSEFGMAAIAAHEQELLHYATEALQRIPGLSIVGTAEHKIGVISFIMSQAHPHDIGTVLDSEGVAIRAGHHCTMPLMDRFGIPATARASFGLYNEKADVDHLVHALYKVIQLFGE